MRYSRLFLLLISYILAYFIFTGKDFGPIHSLFLSIGIWGSLAGGFFYAFGFTAAPATAVLLIIAGEQNYFLAGVLAGLGALIGDLGIFFFLRGFFARDLTQLSKTHFANVLRKEERLVLGRWQKYLSMIIAGFIIASPLPTEIGVAILSSNRRMSTPTFALTAFGLHTLGIFTILGIGRLL
ncbi:hypothetical protein A2V54_01655 [candidate division WWE3 bacterium RBG_19FT_COMBO_53_11]|uniref:TVP38/TMEM64 family membrane protein n=1 Tax=candidate division WWE3 bacterium RBG_19FT_COMBO_53_11 TaxID=1802613 RepID=A0A1F4UIH3_UNCKA|nr:MAG: hypothetical protein A2V54_01655 [candidate division WWE3 bacterium RBG_19FT_COMBO_53_11]